MGRKMTGRKDGQSFFCLKTAYIWNAARTVRSPGFLGLALQRAAVLSGPDGLTLLTQWNLTSVVVGLNIRAEFLRVQKSVEAATAFSARHPT
jgi:hypothetical protein